MLHTIKTLSQEERSFLFKIKRRLMNGNIPFFKMNKYVLDLCFSEFLNLINFSKIRYRKINQIQDLLETKRETLSDKMLNILFFLDLKSSLIFVLLNREDKILKSLSIGEEVLSIVNSVIHRSKIDRVLFCVVVLIYFSLKNTKIVVKRFIKKNYCERKYDMSVKEPVGFEGILF